MIAVYDYWGYYNVCYLGAEIRNPARVIPRAILLSIAGVALLYLTMNITILGAMPWQEVEQSKFIASDFMQRIWGPGAGIIVTVLMLWTAFASVFSLLLGYSRVPYAAAVEGDYFPAFARVHPVHAFPYVSLLVLGGMAILFCLFRLADVVTALVVIRIIVQFLAQTLRHHRPAVASPGRAAAVPHVALPGPRVAGLCGVVYVVVMRPNRSSRSAWRSWWSPPAPSCTGSAGATSGRLCRIKGR